LESITLEQLLSSEFQYFFFHKVIVRFPSLDKFYQLLVDTGKKTVKICLHSAEVNSGKCAWCFSYDTYVSEFYL